MLQKIINADDFGISPGVNKAIITAFKEGVLNSASLMVNMDYAGEAVKLAKDNPGLKVGLHINLTNGKCVADAALIPLLADKEGDFKHYDLGLAFLSVLRMRAFRKQAEIEVRAQIEKAKSMGIALEHLDAHRHIHMIPVLFSVVKKLQKEYGIPRVRVINERFWKTFPAAKNWRCFIDGGVIKFVMLKSLYYFNYCFNSAKSDVYFYSILYTTRLFGKNVEKIKVPKGFRAVEICTHPCIIAEDKKLGDEAFKDYILIDRQKEFEALLDKGLLERISD